MNTYFKYITLTAIAVSLCSCNKETLPGDTGMQVQISAKIAPCVVTRVTEDGTAFSDGDAIQVQNMDRKNKHTATYSYSAGTGKWNTTDELYWNGDSDNTFNAWYPSNTAYDTFEIPANQTTGIYAADWMTATTSAKRADEKVELSFSHHLAKVRVTVEGWTNEFAENEKVVNSLEIKSLSRVMYNQNDLAGDNSAIWIKTYTLQPNTSFLAIIAPGEYNSDKDIMQVYVNGSNAPLTVRTSSDIIIESGKAYNFKLTIGKVLATITSSVSVGEWNDMELDDQQASSQQATDLTAELM